MEEDSDFEGGSSEDENGLKDKGKEKLEESDIDISFSSLDDGEMLKNLIVNPGKIFKNSLREDISLNDFESIIGSS